MSVTTHFGRGARKNPEMREYWAKLKRAFNPMYRHERAARRRKRDRRR